MGHDYEPLVGEVRLGSLVEVHGLSQTEEAAYSHPVNGVYGQATSYAGGSADTFRVHLANGIIGHFHPKNLRVARDIKRPGEGGSPSAFDLLMGPRTDASILGQELSRSLLEKGFCVLKYTDTDESSVLKTVTALGSMAADDVLRRFPEECESGYLGRGCKGKVCWMDYAEDSALSEEETLRASDKNLSYLAEVLAPFSHNLLGDHIDERTSALVCLSMKQDEERDYPFPEPDDHTLGVFLQTWRRTLVRAVHFIGPGTASLELTLKDGTDSILPVLQRSVSIQAAPGTVFLFRADTYDYKCTAPEETLMVIANYLSRGQQYKVLDVEGNVAWLSREGPTPSVDKGIHVVNTSVRLPGGMECDFSYCTGLVGGLDVGVEVPHQRWDLEAYWSSDECHFEANQTTTKHQSLLEGAELFDHKYFEISVAEASGMDPTQRLILETGAQSMAMAGYSKKASQRRAIHAGFAVGNDRLDWLTCEKEGLNDVMGSTSSALSIMANRFSFAFNLRGPNFVCDSSSSASLCSTHCAKLMMLDQKFDPLDFFLSMGANMCLSVGPFIVCSHAHMTSPRGRCFTFDQSADGYLRGEGVSGFMMKYGDLRGKSEAMLRATQIGQDGKSATLTAPNGLAQEEMINRTMREAEMLPSESTAWECHGTGVPLGDPIEVNAVRKVQLGVDAGRERTLPLMLAANKTNLGHLEGGSAMTSIVKCILQCRYATCYATQHVNVANPHVEHDNFDVLFPLEASGFRYLQGYSQVSSFGHGGTIGHAIFWGEDHNAKPDIKRLWEKKVSSRRPPEVRPMGPNPDNWEADFPDTRTLRDDTKYQITLSPDDPPEEPVRFELKEEGPDLDLEDVGHYFHICGNFNNWGSENMAVGNVPGVFKFTVTVPVSGTVEWRFLRDGNADEIIGPALSPCNRKSESIVGPKKGLKNKWVVHAMPGHKVDIEFFCKRGVMSVLWLRHKDD